VGTDLDGILEQPEVVQATMDQADIFFMDEAGAVALFGSVTAAKTVPGKFLFITLGDKGALVIQGGFATEITGLPSAALDSPEAGDTFWGATLDHLLQGTHPIMAVRAAMPLGERVVVNASQTKRVAQLIAGLADVAAYPFADPPYPAVGHPAALDFFFAATLQQFGFWTTAQGRYDRPLIAPIDGETLKGSDYLWKAYGRRLDDDAGFYSPERQADLTWQEMVALFRADDGTDPMPALELHLEQAQQYGRDMLALGLTPTELVRLAQASPRPLETSLMWLDHIGGYKEDPLRKKPVLLAMILNQRPEAYLAFGPDEHTMPVVDYHLLRSSLRMGLIDVVDGQLHRDLIDRRVLSPADEWAVRSATYLAIEQVAAGSGKSGGAVDNWLFFNSRKRCLEMTEPECALCPVDALCAHRKELFQPVIRTTFY
jgi:hypothetical protein